jgi:hypothetical protein
MINSHGIKQMQSNFHHQYHDHNLFKTHKTPGERTIKKSVCYFLKKTFKEVGKEMQNTTSALASRRML